MIAAYPLQWPAGWSCTKHHQIKNGISADASNGSLHGRIPSFRGTLSSTYLSVNLCPHTAKRCIECIFNTMEAAGGDTVNRHVD